MKRRTLLALAAVAATACIDSSLPLRPKPSFEISDATHGASRNPYFFFLPPMVPNPSAFFHPGGFNPDANPEVAVCELAPSQQCTNVVVAHFSMTSGTGSETIRLDGDNELYIVNWHTDRSIPALDPTKTYRIRVLVEGAEAGFADVDVLQAAQGIRKVDTDEFVPLVDGRTLPIKFRIETSCADATRECVEQVVNPDVKTLVELTNEFGQTEAFAEFPVGWTDAPAVVRIARLPDPTEPGSGPLGTDLPQWPIFADYFTTAPEPFNELVRLGVCQVDNSGEEDEGHQSDFHQFERANLRLAKGATPETFVILPQVGVADILGDCPTVRVASGGPSGPLWDLARLFLPDALHAATLAVFDGGTGGLSSSFTPVGAVEVVVTAPELLMPINGALIRQNDPEIGCTLSSEPTRGYGFQIVFDWTDATSPTGIAGYELFAKHRDAAIPIVDTFVEAASAFTFTDCNSFVADDNLDGWEWRVRARDNARVFSDYVTGTFGFEPCRLPDESVCRAP